MTRRAPSVALVALVLASSAAAQAQFGRRARPQVIGQRVTQSPQIRFQPGDVDGARPERGASENPTSPLRARFGTDRAETLLRMRTGEDVRRGIERAAAAGTPEAVSLLVAQADQANDDLSIIDLARALAPFAKQDAARQKLVALLDATARPSHTRRGDPTTVTTAVFTAHVDFARRIAARALVASRDPKALDAVFAAAREGGPGQENALRALASDPGATNDAPISPPTSAAAVRALAQTGDLRSLDALLQRTGAPADATTRAAAMIALGQLGDGRVRPIAIAAFADHDGEVRAAAGDALVLVRAPERFLAVAQLLASPDTVDAGVRLAHAAQDGNVVKALAARFAATTDHDLRLRILAALGRGIATNQGLDVLASVAADPRLGGDAVQAIARSPNARAMSTLERIAHVPALRRLAVRGYVVRALLRDERSGALDAVVDALHASSASADRALATFAKVVLGRTSVESALGDRDASVRRAAAMGALASYDGRTLPDAEAILAHWVHEPDDATRAVLGIGLLDGDLRARVPTLGLEARVDAGGADAPLAAAALAARKGDSLKTKIDALLASSDPIMRAHVARGLGQSEEPSATGRLAEASRYEAEPLVRLAETIALARRAPAPSRRAMLAVDARLDPEARIREVASRALEGATPPAPWPVREVAWLRVETSRGAPPSQPMLAAYVTSEGVAIPIAFDSDGYALVPGVPPGDGRIVLSPVVPK